VAVGWRALESNTIASANTAVGYEALGSNTTGLGDSDLGLSTAVGFQALANASGPNSSINDGFGYQALFNLTTGIVNTAIGAQALFALTTGSSNVAIGTAALDSLTTGDSNIALGNGAGSDLTTGNDNILIGFSGSILTADNVIAIGNVNPGATATDSCYIANIWNQAGGSQAVYVSSDGKLGLQVSSRRFKDEIRPMERASEIIYALKPVSFRYKKEFQPTHPLSFGLVAEDVAEVNPELVMLDKEGKPVSVRYDQVNAMLLNEFLKEHRKVEEQEATIIQLKQQMAAVVAQLKEQALRIQKVSVQVEMTGHAPELAAIKP
jgi:trimeric autotransporter adhesin